MVKYGEYIRTRAAKAESDSMIRKHINDQIKRGFKLIKYQIGKPGTLDYGRAVAMFTHPANPDLKKIRPKTKDFIWVIYMDYSQLARTFIDFENRYSQKIYQQKAAAEKEYNALVRVKLRGD